MASTIHQPESPVSVPPPRVRLGPVPFHHTLLDGSWRPGSTDLDAELRALVPVLEHARGPVTRLLLSAAGWTARPHQIITAGRPVSVGYLAGQSPLIMRALCADGRCLTMRVDPPGSAPAAPDRPETGRDDDVWEDEGGGL